MYNNYIYKHRSLFLFVSIAFIIILCFIAYGEVLKYYFTSIDAFPLLLTGKLDSINDLYRIFSLPLGGGFPTGIYYRPISELSYGIDYILWGKNPMGYHLTNILLHLANSILGFFIAYFLFEKHNKNLFYAFTTSVLFLLSPLSVALVPSISRRQDMLATFLLILSLLSFARVRQIERGRIVWYMLSLFFGFLAIFAKESSFVLPPLVFLFSFIFDEPGNYGKRAVRAMKYSLPFACFVILNTVLHIYLFGYWGARVSMSIYQHIAAAAKSLFFLAAPLDLLYLSISSKVWILLVLFLLISCYTLYLIFKLSIRGLLEKVLKEELRGYTYLILIVLTYMIIFTISGKSADFYHYLPNMALILLMVMALSGSFIKKPVSILIKSIPAIFILYNIVYSPILTNYRAWENSSKITRQIIKATEKALDFDRKASHIYLINWPGFIGPLDSGLPGRRATILVRYSMDAWARWSGVNQNKNVKFIVISLLNFPTDDIISTLTYTVSDQKITASVTGSYISLPRFQHEGETPYEGDVPFDFSIDRSKRRAKLEFIRKLGAGERIFIYDTNGIRIISNNLETGANEQKTISF